MARVSRVVSQANTRAALIATARPLFRTDGFAATSMESVAAAAGFSKGAVYSNFANKVELGYAVADLIVEEQFARVDREIVGARSVPDYLEGLGRWADAHVGDAEWTLLELELLTHARNDPRMLSWMAQRREQMMERLVGILDHALAELDVAVPLPTREVVTLVLSFGIGVGIQRTFDPSVSVTALTDAFAALGDLSTGRGSA